MRKQRNAKYESTLLSWLRSEPSYGELRSVFGLLNTYYQTGIASAVAYNEVAAQTKNKRLQAALQSIAVDLRKGNSLAVAFQAADVFPPICQVLVEVGEKHGTLSRSYANIELFFRQQEKVVKKLGSLSRAFKQAGLLAAGAVVIMVKFVFPTMAETLSSIGGELPLYSQIVFSLMAFISDYFLLLILFGICLRGAVHRLFKARPELLDKIKMNIPIYKKLYYLQMQQRFCANLSVMLSSGVSVRDAFAQLATIMNSALYRKFFQTASQKIMDGRSMQEVLLPAKDTLLTTTILSFIAAGEQLGKVPALMEPLAGRYAEDVDYTIDEVVENTEFVVMIGAVIGIILIFLALMLPTYSMFELAQ